jgi:hypothetical protein
MSYSPEEMLKWRDSMARRKEGMWEHFCKIERTVMGVGNGEPCNWCGLHEKQAKSLDTSNELKEEKVLLNENVRVWFSGEG